MRRWLIPFLAATAPLIAFLPTAHASSPAVGQAMPDMAITLLDAKTPIHLADYNGKVVILDLWATWCEPCRTEMPLLDAYYKAHKDQGVVVVAISVDRSRDEDAAREMAKPFSFPVALKSGTDLAPLGRVSRIPLTIVIDRDGVVRKNNAFDETVIDTPLLESVVTPLLK